MKVLIAVAALLLSGCVLNPPTKPDPDPIRVGADTVIDGCSTLEMGTVGLGSVRGNVGDTVTASVLVATNDRLDSWTIDLMFPDAISLVDVTFDEGLASDFWFTAFSPFPAHLDYPSGVRIGGAGGDAFVAAGATGTLATMTFKIMEAGRGTFRVWNLLDGLETYTTPCGPLLGVD